MRYAGGVLIVLIVLVFGALVSFWTVVLLSEDVRFSPDDPGIIEDPVSQNVEVSACGTINASGTYTLTSNLVAQRDCLVINASNVIIDGAGFRIIGQGDGFGIKAGAGVEELLVVNTNISGFDVGMNFNSIFGSTIQNNFISGVSTGIIFNGSFLVLLSDNDISAGTSHVIFRDSLAVVINSSFDLPVTGSGFVSEDSSLYIENSDIKYYDIFNTSLTVAQGGSRVSFNESITEMGTDFSSNISLSDNFISVDSVSSPGFNVPANVYLEVSNDFLNPVILRDEVQCFDCVNLSSLHEDLVNFEVPGFSSYSIGEDIFPPGLTVSFPENETYEELDLTFEASLSEKGDVFFSLDGGDNITMDSEGLDFFYDYENIDPGNHSIKFYAEDMAGNVNSSVPIIYFTVLDPDDLPISWSIANVDFDDINTSEGVIAVFGEYQRIQFNFLGDSHYVGVVDTASPVVLEVSNNESFERRNISIGDTEEFDLNGGGEDIEVRFIERVGDQVTFNVRSLSYFVNSSQTSADSDSPGTSQSNTATDQGNAVDQTSGGNGNGSQDGQDSQNGSISDLDSESSGVKMSIILYGVFIFVLVSVIIIAIYLIFNAFSQRNSLASLSS